MKNKDIFEVKNEKGITKTYYTLFTFYSENTKKDYIVYTDFSKDKDNNINVYSSYYDANINPIKLETVETKEELVFIDEMLKKLKIKIVNDNI